MLIDSDSIGNYISAWCQTALELVVKPESDFEQLTLVPMTMNVNEEETVLDTETSIFPPFIVKAAIPILHGLFISPIPKEEEVNVNDSITSKLPSREQNVGGEASGSGGQLVQSMMGQSKIYTLVGGHIDDGKK